MKKDLIIIAGPTAVGKTEVSIKLAKKINAEIISADSVQVYKGLNIGSAKIKKEEMQGVCHHLIDIKELEEDFNVCEFKELVKKSIDEIYKKNKIPIIVGGTGFYIQAVLYDIDFSKEDNEKAKKIRLELEREYEREGIDYLYEKLKKIDFEATKYIHKNNVKRVIRAIEYYLINNEVISLHNKVQREKTSSYNFKYFVLNMDRKNLYNRINERVDKMFELGLLNEFEMLLIKGARKEYNSMNAIGYKELFLYKEKILSLEETKEEIKKNTRHFAKRQLTWFKREKEAEFLNIEDFKDREDVVLNLLSKISFINI